MQTNSFANGFPQTVARTPQQPRRIPGLKVAYGSQAQLPLAQYELPLPGQQSKVQLQPETKNVFSRLKDSLLNLVTEEAPAVNNERPIGISQLSRRTFQATPSRDTAANVFKQGQPIQDYRFNQNINFRG